MSLSISALLVICSCAPNEASQTIGDIRAVADNAAVTVSIIQSTTAANLADRQEELMALTFAEAASRAAWMSASESNSRDSIRQKNDKIIGYFSTVPLASLDHLSNSSLKAGEAQLNGSIKLLLGRMESNRSSMAAQPGSGDVVPTSIPQTLTSHLNQIRQKAIDTISGRRFAD